MSWLFSQALVEAYSGANSSDGEPFVPLNGNPIPQAYCAPDRMTKFSRLSRFGMTYAPLTASRGEELLTWYLAGFPAKTSVPQDTVQASPAVDQDSGLKWRGLLGKYDHATHSWKTAQCSLLEDLEQCLEIWPRWGLMRDGVSYQQQTLVRHTLENESGLWATPTCMESLPAMKSKSYKESQTGRRKISSNLRDQIFQRFPAVTLMENQLSPSIQKKHPLFPTPLKSESNGSQAFKLTDAVEASLGKKMPKSQKNPHKWEEFKTWPTPRLNDYKGGGAADDTQGREIKDGSALLQRGISRNWPSEPDVGRVANGVAARVDRLKAIGNGQVPRVAATAFKLLAGKF